DTPAAVYAAGQKDQAQYIAEGEAAYAKLTSAAPVSTQNANGTTNYTVQMGASTAHTDVLAFSPSPADVKAGDEVTFVNNSQAPHTASFFNSQPPILDPTSAAAA